MSETSKASLSSGQIVGPLWTWMFLIPSSTHLSRNGHRLGVGQLPAARAVVPLGGVELHALHAVLGVVGLELPQAGLALTRVPAAVEDQLAGEAVEDRRVLLDVVEPLRVPLLQVRRLEDRHVDVALVEDVLLEVLDRVLLEVLDRPVRLGRPEPLVRVEALDPALGVLLGARASSSPGWRPRSGGGCRRRSTSRRPSRTCAPPTRQAVGRTRCTPPRPPGSRTTRPDRRGRPYARSGST